MTTKPVVLVTGSTSGIGLGIAKAFAEKQYDVVLNGLGDSATIEAAQKEIRERGANVWYHAANMLKPAEIADMVQKAAAHFGRLDVLVNNAGIQHVATVQDFPDDKWDAVIGINLTAAFHSIKHALPIMRKQGFGRIINIASAHGKVASTGKAAYVAAKHGIVGLTKVVALEAGETNITCNAICPGWVYTPLVAKQIEVKATAEGLPLQEAQRKLLLEKQPNGRFAEIEEIGALAVYLASDIARGITGADLSIDGGWTAQ